MGTSKKITVLKTVHDKGNLGSMASFISAVTEKVIKVICNENCEIYFHRKDGRPRNSERGMSAMGAGMLTNLDNLEKFVQDNGKLKNGVYVWDGGFKLRTNSKGVLVNEKCLPLHSGFKTYNEWFKAMDVELVNLYNVKLK